MFQKLVSHNEDLGRLVDKGLALGFADNHLVIRDIPYLDASGALAKATIVAPFQTIEGWTIRMNDHQIYFAGGVPYQISGQPIANLGGGAVEVALSGPHADVKVERSFSNKPWVDGAWGAFKDHYEKIMSYVSIISGPAMAKFPNDPEANPYTFRAVTDVEEDPIFKHGDTLTTRANIMEAARKFENDTVAIIGLGGTGSYILDFLVKARIPRIRAFDADDMRVHNGLRSPGRIDPAEFGKPKADVYAARYADYRNGPTTKVAFIDEDSAPLLEGVTFAFVAVDSGPSRKAIFALLKMLQIPYIDVGMGLKLKDGKLRGSLRTTVYSLEKGDEIRALGLAEVHDGGEDLYRTNIQIGELNALNACLAVFRFKQLRGFYAQDFDAYNVVFNLGSGTLVREDGAEVVDDED